MEFKFLDYNTFEHKGVLCKVSPEFVQDVFAGRYELEEINHYLMTIYLSNPAVIREKIIDRILS